MHTKGLWFWEKYSTIQMQADTCGLSTHKRRYCLQKNAFQFQPNQNHLHVGLDTSMKVLTQWIATQQMYV